MAPRPSGSSPVPCVLGPRALCSGRSGRSARVCAFALAYCRRLAAWSHPLCLCVSLGNGSRGPRLTAGPHLQVGLLGGRFVAMTCLATLCHTSANTHKHTFAAAAGPRHQVGILGCCATWPLWCRRCRYGVTDRVVRSDGWCLLAVTAGWIRRPRRTTPTPPPPAPGGVELP